MEKKQGFFLEGSLTEPQLLQVLEPPAMAAEHLGQVLCMFALLCELFGIEGQILYSLTMARFARLLCAVSVFACVCEVE